MYVNCISFTFLNNAEFSPCASYRANIRDLWADIRNLKKVLCMYFLLQIKFTQIIKDKTILNAPDYTVRAF